MTTLEEYLRNTMTAMRKERFDKSDQLSLGEIISKCEEIKRKQDISDGSEITVRYDFEYFYPTKIKSWRGVYSELALDIESGGKEMTLSDFIDMLKAAVGKTFEGYKGGDYLMSRHTPVWVANYGNSGNTAVIDVVDAGYIVILVTAYRET